VRGLTGKTVDKLDDAQLDHWRAELEAASMEIALLQDCGALLSRHKTRGRALRRLTLF
jgi:hypothetical protein